MLCICGPVQRNHLQSKSMGVRQPWMRLRILPKRVLSGATDSVPIAIDTNPTRAVPSTAFAIRARRPPRPPAVAPVSAGLLITARFNLAATTAECELRQQVRARDMRRHARALHVRRIRVRRV